MCGICGQLLLDGSPVEPDSALRPMLGAMVHRGPDDEGTFADGPVALGMRRLSILDLAGGHQPIFNEDRSAVVVCNGEIYNYEELREGLIRRGHRFSTRSDTEVIVHLYEERGPDCVRELNGMFAFAAWDRARQRLTLARDRIGIKPLYYYEGKGRLLFASELSALMRAPGVPAALDPAALDDYFTWFYIPGRQSVYRAVRRLPEAHVMVVEDGRSTRTRYWSLSYPREAKRRPLEHYAEGYREQLKRSVTMQLCSDVPLGIFLSGGLDSGSLVAALARTTNRTFDTFTIGFDDPSYDESPYARATAEAYGTNHREYRVGPDDLRMSAELMAHFGEPFGPFTMVQSYLLCKRSREHVTVALAGDGGDELFGGYPTYVASRMARAYLALPKLLRRGVIERVVRALPVSEKLMSLDFKLREFVRGAEVFRRADNMAWKIIFGDAEREELFTPDFRANLGDHDPYRRVAEVQAEVVGTPLQRAMYYDLTVFLTDCVLTQTDRMSMAVSQEVRVPILDHEMIEFAASVPDRYKVRRGRTKLLVREAMKGWLPERVLEKPKSGFTTPVPVWLRNELRDFVTDTLSEDAIRRTGVLRYPPVKRLLDEHFERRADHARRIWAVVNYVLWNDTRRDPGHLHGSHPPSAEPTGCGAVPAGARKSPQ